MSKPEENGRRDKSKFTHTCTLLSQYIKEKGALRDLAIDMMAPRPPPHDPKGKLPPAEEPPRKAVVLPDLNAVTCDVRAPQMTIFYAGKVLVFDNLPEEKVREVIAMACDDSAARVPTARSFPPPVPASTSGAAPAEIAPAEQRTQNAPAPAPAPLPSDLPIARRVSLNRFLEKRKDRISSKAPYQVQFQDAAKAGSSSSSPRPNEKQQPNQEEPNNNKSWLGLAPGTPSSSSEEQKKQ